MEACRIKVSFIIMIWNSARYIENCLKSIRDNYNKNTYEVIVIDNGSTDNGAQLARSVLPSLKLITNKVNRGVCARNQGVEIAQGEYIVFLDSDTMVVEDAIDKMIEYMDQNEMVGICSPRLLYADGGIQENARKFPTVSEKLAKAFNSIARKITKKPGNVFFKNTIENRYYYLSNVNSPIEIDYSIAACQVIRGQSIKKVGMLDEKIFYGPEDVDFCLRMWLGGYKVVYFPDAEVIHYEQRITAKRFFNKVSIMHLFAMGYYFSKHKYLFNPKRIYSRIENNN
jgi:GT2 family glycosyltransferase